MPVESPLRPGQPDDLVLIETFRYEPARFAPAAGFIRLPRHLARMAASAAALGFIFDESAARAKLAAIGDPLVHEDRGAKRIRLSLKRDGAFSLATQPFAPLPPNSVWRLAIAKNRLDSADPLLRHKTSRRSAYEKARAEFDAGQADEVLLSNERGEICEGTITNVFVQRPDGSLATPPLPCGLLPGVLRGELLDSGRAVEQVLKPADLGAGAKVFVGNSLRGLIPAALVLNLHGGLHV